MMTILGSIDGSIKLWSINNQSTSLHLKYASNPQKAVGVTSVVTTQDNATAVVCYQDSTIRFFDLQHTDDGYSESNNMEPGLFEAFSLSLSPADDLLVSGNMSGKQGRQFMWCC